MSEKKECASMSQFEAARAAERARPSITSRMGEGKALRTEISRKSHATWSPSSDRPDPVELLQAEDKNRLTELLPIRYGRMAASPFTFFRGSATVMARDLSKTPTS